MDKIKIIVTYDSGRTENHFVKKTKGPKNVRLSKLLRDLRMYPKVKSIKVLQPEEIRNEPFARN